MKTFGLSDIGKRRQENQDCFQILDMPSGILAAVCDGMGGAAAGDVASKLTCECFISHAAAAIEMSKGRGIAQNLRTAADFANREVYKLAVSDKNYHGMGSTLVACYAEENHILLLNVGDSRAYRISGNTMTKLTRDHSLVQEMIDRGEITPEQAKKHPDRNVITRVVGGEIFVRCDLYEAKVQPGDTVLLCSDGLINAVDEKHIVNLCNKTSNPEELCRNLIQAALDANARDNVTVVALLYEKEAAENEQ